jgi:ubiquinone biosynthesis protein UbiJ
MPPSNPFSSPPTLTTPVIAAINHLLAQEAWARDALMLHAGKQACIDAGGVALQLRVSADGMVEASDADQAASVTIRVKLADLPLIAQNRERAFSYVQIEGDAELANTMSQLAKGLRWEAEHDLERVIGPIGATRLVDGARGLLGAARAGQQKIAENVAEYFLEENPLLIRPAMADEFAGDVNRLRDDVERMAKRIARLEAKLAPAKDDPASTTGLAGQQNLDL